MKKTIFQVVSELNDGGAETLIKDYSLLLSKKQHNIIIITIYDKRNSSVYKMLKKNGVIIVSIFRENNLFDKIVNKIMKKTYLTFKFKKLIIDLKPDVIHFHMIILKYFAPLTNYLENINLFYTCHSLPERYFGSLQKEEYFAAKKLIEASNLKLIALHNLMAEQLKEMFQTDKVYIIKNGVDFNKFKNNNNNNKNEIRKMLGIDSEALVIGHVGRFAASKNHEFIINVFQQIHKKKSNAVLLLIGNGELLSYIRNLINAKGLENSVIILNHRDDVNNLLQAMDVFIFPSIYEGLGIALIEAQVAGLRCVVSDNVPKEAILTKKTFQISLKAPLDEWCEYIVGTNKLNTDHGNLSEYDINKEIENLERLYNDV